MNYKVIRSGICMVVMAAGLDSGIGSAMACPTLRCASQREIPPMDLSHTHTTYTGEFMFSGNNDNSYAGTLTVSGGGNSNNGLL